ncbi:MAG: ribbon-helix-helix protein, CopG family [Bryobacterales bacterium]|nr:ribbon-helix-helix protein, CopG family [Bryobacterales bacterium]
MKSEVYSWRVPSDVKASLEREARRQKLSMSAVLAAAARDWLQKSAAADDPDEEQRRLHKSASKWIGTLESGKAQRSETTSNAVRDRLRRQHGR